MKSLSKVTTKYQTSLPKEVRERLSVQAGDYVTFEIKGKVVTLRKVENLDKNLLKLMQQNMQEWNSKEDDEQFAYLEKLIKKS
jgi:antitoxin PrlF